MTDIGSNTTTESKLIRASLLALTFNPAPLCLLCGCSKEVREIYRSAYLRASIMAPFFSSAKLMVFLTLVTYVVYLRGALTASTVFVVIGLYNVLRLILNLFVPMAIQFGFEMKVAIDRIQVSLRSHSTESV